MPSSNIAPRSRKFYPQLEGLRAFAIFFIVLSHWTTVGPVPAYWMEWAGVLGVTYFYVLSGFLIGNILLNEKQSLSQNNFKSTGKALITFYTRRILRTLPAFYLLLIILIVLKFPYPILSISPWFFLNLGNLYFFFCDCWSGMNTLIGHFWTLAVEEQFYLVFPLIIFFVPKRFAFRAIIIMGICGIVCRMGLYLLKFEYFRIFTLSSFDAFALGALLSYVKIKNISIPYIRPVLIFSFLLYIFLPTHDLIYFTGKSFLNWLIPSGALLCAGIIFFASGKGIRGFKFLLENKMVLFIGKIGYGLYLYHMFVPTFTTYVLGLLGYAIVSVPVMLVVEGIILILIATISYYIIEKPIYSLKKYFQYTSVGNAL